MIPEISPRDLALELQGENPPTLIDVREPDELEISRFPTYIHVPLRQLVDRLSEFQLDANLVIVCRSGSRSGHATLYMQRVGFTRVRNLSGGINEWAVAVDPSLPQY